MILIAHELIGTAFASHYSNYAVVFLTSFASHYVFDAMPHWHYPTPRIIKEAADAGESHKAISLSWELAPEIVRVIFDFVIGIVLSLLLFLGSWKVIIIAVLGAATPDMLVGASKFYPYPVLLWHDKFHNWIHSETKLDAKPILGIGSQIAIVAAVVFIFR